MKKLLAIILLSVPLVVSATTNIVNTGTLFTNNFSRVLTNQLDTNNMVITNMFGASGYGNQFSTNNGPLNLAVGLTTTNLVDNGVVTVQHLSGASGSYPGIALLANAGSTATFAMNSTPNDTSFSVTVTPSGSGIANGDIFQKTFQTSYATAPSIVFCVGPVGTNAYGKIGVVSEVGVDHFKFAASGLVSGTAYTWTFHTIQ